MPTSQSIKVGPLKESELDEMRQVNGLEIASDVIEKIAGPGVVVSGKYES